MAENPRSALRQARPDTGQEFTFTGPATISVLDDAEHRHALVLYEFEHEGLRMSAYADAEDVAVGACGSTVRLHGWRAGDRAAISSGSIVHDAGSDICSPTGEQHIAIVLLYGPSGRPGAVTPAQVNNLMFGSGPETPRQQYLKSSYEQLSLTGNTFGWYRMPRTYACSETDAMRADALAAAAQELDLRQYQRLILLLDPSVRNGGACAWTGMGQIGCATVTANAGSLSPRDMPANTTSTAWLWMTPTGVPVATIIHEFGHNLGLGHARSIQFPRDTLEPDLSRIYYKEYGDPISLMGHGSGPFAASQKLRLGWINPEDILSVEQDGDFVLQPLQALTRGSKSLRIRRRPGGNEWLWLEYRQPDTDYDNGSQPTNARYILRYETPNTGYYSDALAPIPAEDPNDAVFEIAPGSTWRDVHSALTIETGNPTTDGAPVRVRFDVPCASVNQNSIDAAAAGQSIVFTVNAPSGCAWTAQSNAVWLDVSPAGTQLGPGSVTLMPAANGGTARSGSVTIGRQPVYVQQAGAKPTPSLISVFPAQGSLSADTFFGEISFLQANDVAEVHLLYNTTANEAGGCATRYNLANRTYAVAGPDGLYSATYPSGEFHDFSVCSTGYYVLGKRASGEFYLDYDVALKLSQPSLFIRFLTTDGRTTAWQRAAAYAGTLPCYLGPWQTSVQTVAGGGPSSLNLIGGRTCPWTLLTDAGWIHLPRTSGTGPTLLSLTIDSNPGESTRTGNITVNQQTIPVSQLSAAGAWSVDFYPAEIDVSAAAGLHHVLAGVQPRDFGRFESTVPWMSIESAVSDPIGGPGNSPVWDITFRVEANPGVASRTGSISAAGFSVPVRQSSGGITLSPLSETLPAAGGVRLLSIAVAPDRDWSAVASEDWIQISTETAGVGPALMTYTVAPNTSPSARTGYILFGNVAFEITQVAGTVSLPPSFTARPLGPTIADGFGGNIANVLLDRPSGLAFDSRRNLYISDRLRHLILRVAPDGAVTKFAGNGVCCYSGDGADALRASLNAPDSIAVDGNDNIYVADRGTPRIRRIDSMGIITTVAGTGSATASGDNGPATAAGVWAVNLAFDGSGNLLLCDAYNHSVRMVDQRGVITTIAGTGKPGYSGDGAAARSAQLNAPEGIAVDAAGTIFIADSNNGRIRRISTDGGIDTLASGLNYPRDVKVDVAGNVLVAEYSGRIRRIRPDGVVETVAASGLQAGPYRLATDLNGDVLLAQYSDTQIRRVTPPGVVQVFAGLAQKDRIVDPRAVAVDASGNTYIAEGEGHRIFVLGADGAPHVVASGGLSGVRDLIALADGSLLAADPGQNAIVAIRDGVAMPWPPVANAGLLRPSSLAADNAGNVYVVDSGKHRLLSITASGDVHVIAGDGRPGSTGDGGPASQAQLNYPYTVAVDPEGGIYVAEWRRIRHIGPDGIIQTLLYNDDLGTSATFARDLSGAFIMPDAARPILWRMSPWDGNTVIAGNDLGVTDQEVDARAASFYQPTWMRFDNNGNLFVVDSAADRIYILSVPPNGSSGALRAGIRH